MDSGGITAAGTALLFAVLPVALLWRVLFAGEALFWGTPALQFVPWQRLAAEMWRSGHLPLWNPLLGCGAPLAANYQTGAFYPLYGLALLLPAEVALGWSVALHVLLAGLGMYAWGRAAGLERFPALLAGLALQGSGFLVARAGLFPSIAVTFAWLPVWLWRSERLARSGRLGAALWLGAALGLGLLAGHAQTAFYGLAMVGGYGVWRVASNVQRPSPIAIRTTLLFLLALSLGLSLAAVQLLPTAELLRVSQRAGGVDAEVGLTYSFWPWRLLTLAAPDLFGNPAHGDYWGYATYWEDAVYVGLLPLLLAVEALLGLRRPSPRRSMTAFWLLTGGAALLLALGQNNPLYLWLFEHVPTFDWFQSPARWLAVTTVALAALAGIGAQQCPRGRAMRQRGGLGVALGLATVLGGLAAQWLVPGLRATLALATVRLGLTLSAAGGLALLWRESAGWRAAVVGLVVVDLLVFGWGLAPSVSRDFYAGQSELGAALAADPTVERVFWPAQGQPEAGYDVKFERYFRFDTFGPHELAFWRPLRETLLPNLGALDGVAAANNFEPLRVSWQEDALRAAEGAPALLRAMGITQQVTATVDGESAATPLDAPLGRAWVVHSARWLPTEGIPAARTDPAFDPGREVLLEGGTGDRSQVAAHDTHPVLRDTPNGVTIDVALDDAGYLVLADTWYPGWQATVDGRAAPILRANGAFRAVELPAGEHTVEMSYRPWTVTAGAATSLAALVGLLAGLVSTRKRERPA